MNLSTTATMATRAEDKSVQRTSGSVKRPNFLSGWKRRTLMPLKIRIVPMSFCGVIVSPNTNAPKNNACIDYPFFENEITWFLILIRSS